EAEPCAHAPAVAEVLQAGLCQRFTIKRIAPVIPAQRSAQSDTAPERLIAACKARAGNIDIRTIEEIIVEVGDAIDTRPAQLAKAVYPLMLIITGQTEPAKQAISVIRRNLPPIRVCEAAEAH